MTWIFFFPSFSTSLFLSFDKTAFLFFDYLKPLYQNLGLGCEFCCKIIGIAVT